MVFKMRRPRRNDKLILYKDNFFIEEEKFKSSAIDSSVLYDLAKKMADTTEKKVHDKLEFVDTLDGKAVSEWFKAHAKNVDGTDGSRVPHNADARKIRLCQDRRAFRRPEHPAVYVR